MESCKEHIEKISAMIDGELDNLEKAELLSHIDSCPECKSAYDAFSFISSALSHELAPPPEALASSIMKKIADKKESKKKLQPTLIRFAALAACFALILFGASRLELFNDKLSFTSDSAGLQTANESAAAEEGEDFIDEYQLFDSAYSLDLPEHKSLSEAYPADTFGTAADETDKNFTAYGILKENSRISNQHKNEISLCISDCAELMVYKGEYKDSDDKVRDSALMLTINDKQELEQLSKLLCFETEAEAPKDEPAFTLFIPADFSSSDCMEDITVKIWLDNDKVIFQDSKTELARRAVCKAEAFLEFLNGLSSKQS